MMLVEVNQDRAQHVIGERYALGTRGKANVDLGSSQLLGLDCNGVLVAK